VASVLVDSRYDSVSSEGGVHLKDENRNSARAHFGEVEQILSAAGIAAEHIICEGHPNRELIGLAKERDVDLIVLGARGHSIVARTLLGSTSDYVSNHAQCPVLIARPTKQIEMANNPISVVLAYDGSSGAKIAAMQMFQFKWDESTQAHIAYLLERPNLIPEEDVYDPDAIQQANVSLHSLVTAEACTANVDYCVRETLHVGSALVSLADKNSGDLIFVGDTGKSAIARLFLGSVSRHVLHHSPCSVWIARDKNWHN
jgi:nucleotide-binding universal stress UspA family protein